MIELFAMLEVKLPRSFSILLVAMLAIALVACGDEDNDTTSTPSPAGAGAEQGETINVVATTAQIGALVHEIAGDAVQLHVLMPPGVDPHDYEATPDDLRTVGDADLILKNGIGLDDFLDDSIEAAGSDAEIVVVTEGIELIEGGHAHSEDDDHEHSDEAHEEDDDHADETHEADDDHDHADETHEADDDHDHADETHEADDDHDHDEEEHEDDDHGDNDDGHDHGEFDPHVWHDPANAMVMVDNIAAALAAADSANSETYEANAAAYKTVLEETDTEIRALLDEIDEHDRKLVTTHDAFGYFIHAYDFEFIGAVIPVSTTDAEPSARELAALSDLIRQEEVRAIFAEQTVDSGIAEQLANDTGVEIIYGLHSDSLGEPGSGEDTIHGMLLANATKISEALK